MFLSTTRDTLDDAAQTALRQYVRAGGGFIGVHNAFGTEYNWPWYEGLLGNANFYDHGANQPGTVVTVNRRDASTQGLPRTWAFSDEWYNLIPAPTRVRVLAEGGREHPAAGRTRQPRGTPGDGEHHPVSWCQYYDGGKAWLTTLGHDVKAWTDEPMEGDQYFVQHLLGGVKSVLGNGSLLPLSGSSSLPGAASHEKRRRYTICLANHPRRIVNLAEQGSAFAAFWQERHVCTLSTARPRAAALWCAVGSDAGRWRPRHTPVINRTGKLSGGPRAKRSVLHSPRARRADAPASRFCQVDRGRAPRCPRLESGGPSYSPSCAPVTDVRPRLRAAADVRRPGTASPRANRGPRVES
ncbi:hypothetical protein GCM10020220_087300 [Nonomuraea rubra]